MPITVTCPNPACGQVCAVQDQYAGMQVSCPKCQTVFAVPAAAAPVSPIAAGPPPAAPVAPGAPMGPGFSGAMDNLARLAGDPLSKTLLLSGLGCLLAMIIFTFLPWFSIGGGSVDLDFGGINIKGAPRVSFAGGSVSGIRGTPGQLNLFLSLAAGVFVFVTVLMNRADLFNYSLYAAAGWGGLAAFWRLINVIDLGGFSGIGLYLTLLASLGAAGTFGFMAFQRLPKRPPAPPPPAA